MTRQIVKVDYEDYSISIPYYVLEGQEKGPSAFVSAGMHGDEINGIAIIEKLINQSQEIESRLKGKLILIPLLNPSAFKNGQRHLHPTNEDLNRAFNAKKPVSPATAIATTLEKKFFGKVDFGIDIHDAGEWVLLPHVRIHDRPDLRLQEMAQAFGAKVVIKRRGRPGMLSVAMRQKYDLPVLTVELGGGGRLFPKFIEQGFEGIKQVLIGQEMLPGELETKMVQYSATERYGISAQKAAIVYFDKKLGDRVHSGEKVGYLFSPRYQKREVIKAPCCGIFFSKRLNNQVIKGQRIFSVLKTETCHDSKAEKVYYQAPSAPNLYRLVM